MANAYTQNIAALTNTPQSQQAPGTNQIKNHDGAYVFQISPWQQFERFLILGSEGGTYYVGERKLTEENAKNITKLLELDGKRVVDMIVDVSINGRAYKQSPTLFALALAASWGARVPKQNTPEWEHKNSIRSYALSKLSDVARTGTMFFEFLDYTTSMRGWGVSLQDAVSDWYLNRTPNSLANQLVKYRSRSGWTHKDAIRKAHIKLGDKVAIREESFELKKGKSYTAKFGVYNQDHVNAELIQWTTGNLETPNSPLVQGYLAAQKTLDPNEWAALVTEYNLPWEALPTEALNYSAVWLALAPHMGLTALLRNLGRMGANGSLAPNSELASVVRGRIQDSEAYVKSRVHPMQVLLALDVYGAGKGIKGSLTWTPVNSIVDALNDAFYASFGALQSTGKRRLLALDVSGSMDGSIIMNTHMSARQASTALALVALNQDPDSYITAFSNGFTMLNGSITAKTRLKDAIAVTNRLSFQNTDCSLPMRYALQNGIEVDSFEVYTDNETNAYGSKHPYQALLDYRKKTGINAKLVVNAMTVTDFSIADPNDPGMMDIVGMDANAPKVIEDFIKS